MKPATQLSALGRNPKRDGGSVNPPVHRTSTILFSDLAEMEAYESGASGHYGYGRFATVTSKSLEELVAALEGAEAAFITSSGLAAITTLMAFLSSGDHVLITDSAYGPTRRFCDQELGRLGVETTYYEPGIGADIAKLLKPNTKMVYLESPGSLTFEMQDIPAIAKVAHTHGAIVVADCTWASPLFVRAFELGVDVSIHSATKYMGGHSDLVMGTIACKAKHAATIKRMHHNLGACSGADSCALALRGLRTLDVRMKQHHENGITMAKWLAKRPEIKRVLHPALPEHPGHAIWKRDYKGASGLFAVEPDNWSHKQLTAFIDGLHHFGLGYSWGGYESLAIPYHPAKVRTISKWAKETVLIRFHIGLEAVEDLIADLEDGFKRMKKA